MLKTFLDIVRNGGGKLQVVADNPMLVQVLCHSLFDGRQAGWRYTLIFQGRMRRVCCTAYICEYIVHLLHGYATYLSSKAWNATADVLRQGF